MNKNDSMSRYGPLVGAIDEGTSSARFLVFAAETAEILTYHQIPIITFYPKEGWVEQDPMEILNAVKECLRQTVFNLQQLTIDPTDIVAIGVTNQRETTIVWNSVTGKPLYNAIVWMDMRTTSMVDEMLDRLKTKNKNYLKSLCGLPINHYFSALKLKWLLENIPEIQEALANEQCMFGTVDTWLIWNLTGGVNGGVHTTDVTNASRTMLMNIRTLKWDPRLLSFFEIPSCILPQIRSSSEIYGYIQGNILHGVPISGCLGDQQSALVGQLCFQKGQAKSTYGTGCFLLYNTGSAIVESSRGLLTTVAYQFGPNTPPTYALEGSIAFAGAIINWLRDNLGMLSSAEESEVIAGKISVDNHVTFVPAFSGLYAPYWKKDARSVICGLTERSTKAHIIKAALQSVCFQVKDILETMKNDAGITLSKLLVDGGMINNNLLMQMQADIAGIPVIRPIIAETTALGAAIVAGSAEGIRKWNIKDSFIPTDVFLPSITEDESNILYSQWKKGIKRSIGWSKAIETDDDDFMKCMHKITGPGLFIISTMILLVLAKYRSFI
ncbi:glycerol kinase-like isoform X1 [Vespula pensylvanica]|uniref:glycerol kinase-like isoform X1 n=1 Tax=Vespula pensylvanica TaxID=30213 RepID=UPI001CBA14D7|nr:glycerol kinase-like isoform X1 [Vespula pensylvanica]